MARLTTIAEIIRENIRTQNPELDLSGQNLRSNDVILLQECKHLTTLYLNHNKIKDISFLQYLTNLTYLNIGFNQIVNTLPLENLLLLNTLFIMHNNIVDISPLQNLTSLKNLYIHKNKIVNINPLKNLENLKILMLDNNQINDINSLKELNKLLFLDINNNQITQLSLDWLTSFYNLHSLSLYGNPIQNIPIELLGEDKNYNCFKVIKDYLQSVAEQEKQQQLNEAKLILVGLGDVGKTELVEAISNPKYKFIVGRDTTEGIQIKTWLPKNCKRAGKTIQDFRINIWDFAGQEINYGTHQFFLTKSSLYVFVWESRKGNEADLSFDYWLNIVTLLSGGAPILVVQNKIDVYETDINQKHWKERFPNIIGFYKTSCKSGKGIKELSNIIRTQITRLPHTHEIWNKDRYAIREQIERDTRNYMLQGMYLILCEEKNLTHKQALFLSDLLHKIGVILHFQDELKLKNTLVLKPEWATQAAYLLLDNKRNTNQGYFTEADLATIWAGKEFEDKHDFLLALMLRFELVFNLQGTAQYIVPELLPVEESTAFVGLPEVFDLTFEYQYDFMPKSILSRFTCRNAPYIKGEYFWKYGVWLEEDGTLAKLESNEVSKYIRIQVVGKEAEKLLYLIRRDMALIHQYLKNPSLQEVIPCICSECRQATKREDKHFFSYQTLQKFIEKGRTHAPCNQSGDDVLINELLKGIKSSTDIEKYNLLLLIEMEKIPDFFASVKKLKLENVQFRQLEQEFIGGQATQDVHYINRLRTWVGSL